MIHQQAPQRLPGSMPFNPGQDITHPL